MAPKTRRKACKADELVQGKIEHRNVMNMSLPDLGTNSRSDILSYHKQSFLASKRAVGFLRLSIYSRCSAFPGVSDGEGRHKLCGSPMKDLI